jgi:hypothetical protein
VTPSAFDPFRTTFFLLFEVPLEAEMIEVVCNDRLGKKVRVKCK